MRAVWIVLVSVVMAAMCVACGSSRQCVVADDPLAVPLDAPGQACPRFGVSTPGGPAAPGEYRAVADAVGVQPSVVLWFVDFSSPPPIAQLDAVRGWGADPVITWEPWRWVADGEYDRSAFPMEQIAAGVHDDYLYRWADELAAWGDTVYLRFAHEANGDWYPWSPAGGTPPQTYVDAWRHVHDLFAVKGVHNVRWVWTVNVPHPGSSPVAPLYPGDDYVDVVGVDGYNWGTTQPWSSWQEPEEIFGPTLDEVAALAPDRPVMVTEVASAEAGGSKPEWIRDLVAYLESRDELTAFVWFDHHKETDWRLASSPESAEAMAGALNREHRTR